MSPVKLGTALPTQIAVFDTETTGTDVETARIVSAFIGVMDVATGEVVERWSWLLNAGVEIPIEASDVHGITTERMRAEGTNAANGIYEMVQRLDILDRRGLVIVAMNATFDFTLLDRETQRHWPGMRPLMAPNDEGKVVKPLVFDPMVLDRAIDKYRKGTRKLVDLARVYGVPVEENAHDAEADCRMAGRVAIKLMGHSRLQPFDLIEVHRKTIDTHRNNANGLADYWATGKGLEGKTPEERRAAVKDVRDNAGLWPMRPRPNTEGAIQ